MLFFEAFEKTKSNEFKTRAGQLHGLRERFMKYIAPVFLLIMMCLISILFLVRIFGVVYFFSVTEKFYILFIKSRGFILIGL